MDETLDRNTRAGLNKFVVKVRATGRDLKKSGPNYKKV